MKEHGQENIPVRSEMTIEKLGDQPSAEVKLAAEGTAQDKTIENGVGMPSLIDNRIDPTQRDDGNKPGPARSTIGEDGEFLVCEQSSMNECRLFSLPPEVLSVILESVRTLTRNIYYG
jgi:hypothetical protein